MANSSAKPSAYKRGCLPQNYFFIHEKTVRLEGRRLFFMHMPSGERHQYAYSNFGEQITSTKPLLRTDALEIVGVARHEPEQIWIGDKSLEIVTRRPYSWLLGIYHLSYVQIDPFARHPAFPHGKRVGRSTGHIIPFGRRPVCQPAWTSGRQYLRDTMPGKPRSSIHIHGIPRP